MSFEKEYYEHEGFWDGEMLLDKANSERFKETIELIPTDIKSLVDLGCGNGVFLNNLKKEKKIETLLGVDRSSNALKYLKTDTLLADINNTKLPDNSFDCVTSLQVIEHLPTNIYEESLQEITRISKKYIIVGVPFNEKREDAYTKCPSCLTIFNRDLHLRSYDKDNFQNLLKKYGFENIELRLQGKTKKFIGHDLYKSIFYPSQNKFATFQSPICPLCGYKEKKIVSSKKRAKKPNKSSLFSLIKSLPKIIWPKKTSYYWVIGVFKKID